jgi:hypothetical protein
MFRALRIAFPVLAAAVAVIFAASTAFAQVWESSAQYGSWTNDGYTLNNNIWGSGAGPQTIWANSYSDWGVYSDQPNTSGVKSYPEVIKDFGDSVSSYGTITSSFSDSLPGTGDFESAYDIWADSNDDEIMVWTDTHNVGPVGSEVTSASIGGQTWGVYEGSDGHEVYSFVLDGNETSGSVNITDFFNWLSSEGWLTNATLESIDFGWEISSTNDTTEDFTVTSYSLSS